ncbi:sugar ABC transporter permease [Tessaracoccus rhinocerotis]|uniref:Sugar ABC transporter permease n=1 Tax=Tessaracoccus rhinocerotis TaxID=1689449 RepID=A0A553K0K2_9ACTN|nr:sugar ABC transporter permease [Tessaracoccus rhinocerotis]TRY18236.1 sugar ABC transporter permease [Tessaracoccus rhinocerotis]
MTQVHEMSDIPVAGTRRAGHRGVDRVLIPFLAPAIALMTLVLVFPSAFTVLLSLVDWRGPGAPMEWVGIDNYTSLWTSRAFRVSFTNTLVLVFLGGAGIFAVVFFSLMVLRGMRGAGFIRSVIFVPYIISPIAIGAALGFLLNPQGGLNTLLDTVGLERLQRAWLAPEMVFQMIVIGLVWSVSGFYIAIVATGTDQIPPYLYEEAELAGASRWKQFWLITVPLSWESVSVASTLWIITGMKTFEIVIAFVGSQSSPPLQARTAAVQQYLATTGGPEGVPQLGRAAAVGIAIFVVTTVLVLILQRVMRRERIELS